MKKIINLIYCLVFLSTQTILSQTLIWTSPSLTNGTVYSGWFVLQNNPLELRFYTYDETNRELKIMDGPLSNTPLLETTLESSERFDGTPSFDYSGDGLNDIIIIRSYPPPNQRYGIRYIDVSNGQTLFTFDDETYSYDYELEPSADINGDGHTEIVIYRSDLNFTNYEYLVYTTDGIPSLISHDINTLPNELKLNQNYPNPFNPATKIEYNIPQPGNVKINIYDIAGRLVKELINDETNAGKHSVVWNGKDNFGHTVASGSYYYQIISGNFVQAKKMIYLK